MSTRRYLVTGGASGIGRAVSSRLLADGHHVTILDRQDADLDAAFIRVDLTDPVSIRAVPELLDGAYHGLANVAGVSGLSGADQTLRVNFLGLRELTRQVAPVLEDGSGIVNVASRAGHQWPLRLQQHLALADTPDYEAGLAWLGEHPVVDNNAYPYSKEVLRVWTQLYATQAAARRIRVNVVNPGPVDTPILGEFTRLLGDDRMTDGIVRAGRPGLPEDIAPVIVWLLGDDAHWVNGADIAVDGGLGASYIRTPMQDQPGIATALPAHTN